MNGPLPRISVVVPTLNGGPDWVPLCRHLARMRDRFGLEVLVIDSGSSDGTVDHAREAGFRVHEIPPSEFGHGRTRNVGVRMVSGDIVCFLTQDVLPCTPDWPLRFAEALSDPSVAGVYGRQVPRSASTMEMFFVSINYPAEPLKFEPSAGSHHPRPGRVLFSNAFSAVQRDVALGTPFIDEVPVSEDQVWAHQVLSAGYSLAYEPAAEALHAHTYSLRGLFRRTFLVGRALRMIGIDRGASLSESVRFLAGEVGYFIRQGHTHRIPRLLAYEFTRWFGFQAGRRRPYRSSRADHRNGASMLHRERVARAAPRRLSLGQATVASAVADGTIALATLLTVPYLVSRLGVEPYGVLVMIAVLAGQFGALHLGISPAATRRVAETRGRMNSRDTAATIRAAAFLGVAAAGLAGATFAVLGPIAWEHGFRGSPHVLNEAIAAVPAGVALLAVQPLLGSVFGVLLGEERFALFSAFRLTHGLVRIAAVVSAVAAGGGIETVLWVQAGIDIAGALLLWCATHAAWRVRVPPRETFRAAWPLLLVGVPFAGAEIIGTLLVDAEKFVLGLARSIEDFTYYTVPYQAVFRLGLFAAALSMVLMPRVSAVASAGDAEAAVVLTRRATQVTAAGMLALLAPLIAVAPELLELWLGAEFAARASTPCRILLVAMFINSAVYAAHAAVRARARPMTLPLLYGIQLPIYLAVLFACVRFWGIEGAALAWALRVTADALAQRALASRALGTALGGDASLWTSFLVLGTLAMASELVGAGWPLRLLAGVALATAGPVYLLSSADIGAMLSVFRFARRTGAGAMLEPSDMAHSGGVPRT